MEYLKVPVIRFGDEEMTFFLNHVCLDEKMCGLCFRMKNEKFKICLVYVNEWEEDFEWEEENPNP